MDRFPAVAADGPGPASLTQLGDADLPPDPVLVEIAYSSLNYKDGLAVTGRGKVVRSYPMTCGIDLAGTVTESSVAKWSPGDEIVVTGCGLGEEHPGGFTTRQRLRPEWLIRLPEGFDHRRAMAIGTAGLTAMLAVIALEHNGLTPHSAAGDGREVLVTGAGGGVGTVAIALLSRLGYRVIASTGRPELHERMHALGAAEIIERAELAAPGQRPLGKERWDAAIDTVGTTTLANAISQTRRGGTVAACGLAGGSDLPTTVLPFILRGTQLAGIDSVWCPNELRVAAWRRLVELLPAAVIDGFSELQPMSRISELAEAVLAGVVRGRVVIDPRA